jgi:hypothetical protein
MSGALPNIGDLTDPAAFAAARRALDAAEQRARAEQAAAQARAILPALVDRAVAGELVASGDITKAHASVATEAHRVTFLGIVATRFPPLITEAEKVVKAAIAVAHQPVYERGVDLRIESAIMSEVARPVDRNGNLTGHTDSEAREAAWKTFQHANKLLHYAARKGVHIAASAGISEHGPGRPHAERRAWRRPAPDGAA